MRADAMFATVAVIQSAVKQHLEYDQRNRMKHQGLIIVYTGNGKGKTTAALGMAARSAGWGEKTAIIQFIKGYKETGEWKLIDRLDEIDIFQTLEDKGRHIGKPEEKHRKAAEKSLNLAKKIISENLYSTVILDEINNAIHHGLLEEGEIMKLMKNKPVEMTLVFTGRDATQNLINSADLVTEMREIKHPWSKGIPAKKGIDF